MCSIRFRAELCRTVDLEGRRWEALIERTNLSQQAWMYSTFEMIRNVLPLACMVSFHTLKAVILMLLSTGSAKSVSLPFYRNRSLELFYLYPDNAPTIMFSIFSDMEISEVLIPRNIYFFWACHLKEYDHLLFCLVFLHSSILLHYTFYKISHDWLRKCFLGHHC